jgi:hypothetical protein
MLSTWVTKPNAVGDLLDLPHASFAASSSAQRRDGERGVCRRDRIGAEFLQRDIGVFGLIGRVIVEKRRLFAKSASRSSVRNPCAWRTSACGSSPVRAAPLRGRAA